VRLLYASFPATTAPWLILTVGFLLPTDVRLRANGICHTFGQAADTDHDGT
jgi:hypothetical protein